MLHFPEEALSKSTAPKYQPSWSKQLALQASLTYSYSIQLEKKKSQHTSWCLPSTQAAEDALV